MNGTSNRNQKLLSFCFHNRYSAFMQCPQGRYPASEARVCDEKNILLLILSRLPDWQLSLPYIFSFLFPPKVIVPVLMSIFNLRLVSKGLLPSS